MTTGTQTIAERRLANWDEMERRALRQFLADLPDAREYAFALPLHITGALTRTITRGGRRAANEIDARMLRPLGLCDYGSLYITNFGCAVLREISGDGK